MALEVRYMVTTPEQGTFFPLFSDAVSFAKEATERYPGKIIEVWTTVSSYSREVGPLASNEPADVPSVAGQDLPQAAAEHDDGA